MKLKPLTKEEIINHPTREYNPLAWEDRINRMDKFKDCQFYIAERDFYEYDRFYATYTIPEGLRLLNSISYSSSLTNNGFRKVHINSETGEVTVTKFKDATGKEGYAENDLPNRYKIAKECKEFGIIVSTENI